jgi:hypothetical protein
LPPPSSTDRARGELGVVGHLARRVPADQISRLEDVQRLVEVVDSTHRLERASPERLPDHRCSEQSRTRSSRHRVDAGGDRRLDRHRQLVGVHARNRRGQLLEKEGIALGDLDQTPDIRRSVAGGTQQVGGELGRVCGRERLEKNRRLGDEAASPRRVPIEKLGPGESDEDGRLLLDRPGEVLEQLELTRLRPVDVLEGDERRLREPERLDEASRREEEQPRLLGTALAAQPEQQPEVAARVLRLLGRQQLVDGAPELLAGNGTSPPPRRWSRRHVPRGRDPSPR